MGELRIAAMLGPAAVLYLLADLASRTGHLSPWQIAIALVALVVSIGPRFVGARVAVRELGARRVGWLGTLGGVALAARLDAEHPSTVSRIVGGLTLVALGAVVLDLVCVVPDSPRALARVRPAFWAMAVAVAAMTLVASVPVVQLPGLSPIAVSPRFALAPFGYAFVAFVLATLLRAVRERLGATPATLAANAWALLGIVPSTLVAGAVFAAYGLGARPGGFRWDLLGFAFVVVFTLYGHVALVEPARRIEAASVSRRFVEWAVAGALVMVVASVVAVRIPRDPLSAAFVAVGLLAFATAVRRITRPVARRLLAPYGGRLLDAIDHASGSALTATNIEAFAEAILGPLRVASGSNDAEPRLVLTDPPLAIRIDAAGLARTRRESTSEALLAYFSENISSSVSHAELDAQVVRKPELRALHDALTTLDALVAVPIVSEGTLDAILLVAKGRRSTRPSLEEIDALERFAVRVSPVLSLLAAHLRAEARVGQLALERDRANERAEGLDDEVRRLRTDVRVLRQGRGAVGRSTTVVAYSEAGRDLERAIAEVAPTLAPVTLVAEPGMHVDRVASRIHAASGVAEGPFVLVDCAAMNDDDAPSAFFGVEGDAGAPGYLRLADGGTLLLADVAAIPMPVQRALAEALSARGARSLGSHAIYGFDTRLIAATRRPVDYLVETGVLDAELGRRLGQAQLRVPPLRERRDDLPSLALLAVDLASRKLGRPPLGLDAGAVEQLVAYDWPGNVRELELILELAVERTEGEIVLGSTVAGLLHVAAEATAAPVAESLEGSLVDIERRALVAAMDKAGGNKSVAARILGIPRTTFLDKLRRFGLDDTPSMPPGAIT